MLSVIFAILAGLNIGCSHDEAKSTKLIPETWPKVVAFKNEFQLADHTNQSFKLEIKDEKGKPLYLLQGHMNAWDFAGNDFWYSGDFECRLTELGVKHSENLLAEDENATRDSQSRGRFLRQELESKCWDYPDYGHLRCFKLRGMELCIEIGSYEIGEKDKDFKVKRLKKMALAVSVKVDNSAKREFAEWSQYAEPVRLNPGSDDDLSLDCSKVIKK
jgi:hypothetical protein